MCQNYMFVLAFGIGIYAYLIFLLGITRFLYTSLIFLISLIFWGEFFWWKKKEIISVIKSLTRGIGSDIYRFFASLRMTKGRLMQQRWLVMAVFGFLLLQMLVNVIGVFGPEIGFDALWYHLTLPKLFLDWHQVRHISGGLLYYSDMPKLVEMLYIPALALFQETGVKLVHFLFGILSCVSLYKVGRKFFNPLLSVIAVAIFYSNLVVGWESFSAYIDLARTFFYIMSIWGFLNWYETRKLQWLSYTAICVGLGIASKFLALMDLGIFLPLITYIDWKKSKTLIRDVVVFAVISLVIPSPWWIYSYLQTGNPFYPFFTSMFPKISYINTNPLGFISTIWIQFTHSADPVSPLYIAFLPFLFVVKKWEKKTVFLTALGGLSIIIWYISPQTGGGRFLLPYLSVLSLLVVLVFQHLQHKYVQVLFIVSLLFSLVISIGYRAAANAKYIPVLLGKETKVQFLATHLNFSFGDWYDIDGYMAKHIKPTDKVLLYGYHNLYYVDFPYTHESWVKKGDWFNYIATDRDTLPERFSEWKLVYQNPLTHLHLYSDGGKVWIY